MLFLQWYNCTRIYIVKYKWSIVYETFILAAIPALAIEEKALERTLESRTGHR